ncbi:unnamed protein product [Alopecurus aequalis]
MDTSKRIASALTEIPDHLLMEIFLLLPATEDLARVSAACVAFRRLTTDGSFLRRFRRLDAPPLIGFLDHYGFHPAVPPHPSAPADRALSLAADFTFSFLPSHCRWDIRDVRDGRVLLDREPENGAEETSIFTELVVCDPLYRRYVLLPPLPDGLAAPAVHPNTFFCEPSLIPPNEDGGAAEHAAFRVIWFVRCKFELYIFVFSSSTGQWCAAASQDLKDLLLAKGESTMWILDYVVRCHYARDCVYWELRDSNGWNELLVLDTLRMEFSMLHHPPKGWMMRDLGIVEAGDDRLGMFSIFDESAEQDLCYVTKGNRGLCSNKWEVENTISLDSRYRYRIGAATGRYLLQHRVDARLYELHSLDGPDMEYFSLDVDALQLERVCGKPTWPDASTTQLYMNYPPSLLSSPTV